MLCSGGRQSIENQLGARSKLQPQGGSVSAGCSVSDYVDTNSTSFSREVVPWAFPSISRWRCQHRKSVFFLVHDTLGSDLYWYIHIGVMDEALVLSSLQKPRKISIQGTDGKVYSLLCKPKDDLRKDQRLMEFNNMINGFLKRNVEAIKRRMCKSLYPPKHP